MNWLRLAAAASFTLFCALAPASADTTKEKIVPPPHGLQTRLMNGAFDELEAIAAEDRKSHARTVGGGWAIVNFYNILSQFDAPTGRCATKVGYSFDDKRQALERWRASKPASPTPRIALALLWEAYAGVGRGCDVAANTSDEQWKMFYERMTKAVDLLGAVDHNIDPEPYSVEIGAASADKHPKQKLNDLYERATLAFPTFEGYAKQRYYYLLPRWFGAPGEAAAFTRSLLTAPGGEAGLSDYFEVARTALDTERRYDTLLDVTGIDYPMLVKAFVSRTARFGPSKGDMNILMYYAVAARDFKTADLLAKKIGDDWDYWLWGDKAHVDSMLAWVRQWLVLTSAAHG